MVEFEPHHSAVLVLPDLVVQGVAYAALTKCNAPASTMAHRVHVAPAPVTEYDAPAPTVAYRVHSAPASAVEYDAPAPDVAYRVHAAPAPVVTPAPDVAYWAHAAPDPEVYIASAALALDEEKYFISITRLEELNYAALTIQRGWRWTRKRILLRAASEERLEEKLREVRRPSRVCQWEPAPRKRHRASGISNPP